MTSQESGVEQARLAEMLAEEAQQVLGAGVGEHPDPDQLFAYLGDELDAETEDQMRAHLVACKTCSARLLDLEPLSQPDLDLNPDLNIGQEVGDFAKFLAWRDVSRQRRQSPQVGRGGRGGRSRLQVFAGLAAMLLLSVALAFVMAPFVAGPSHDPTLDGLQANLPIHYLDELTRSRSFDESLIEIDADASYWALILTPPPGETGRRFPSYDVEMLGDEGDSVLLRSEGLVPSDHGALRLGIPRSLVPEGKVALRLTGVDGERRAELETYALRIRYR